MMRRTFHQTASARKSFGLLAALFLAPLLLHGQSITFSNGVQKYASLSSTAVTMSGKCELWVTNATTPLSGCTINLNSVDAWLFLTGVKPSVAAASYLSQVKVSGASAVADNNVRVVQYGQSGSVVIPHSSSFLPLTAFSQAQFGGSARQYGQWTYYTGTSISSVSSFKLKRGYQAVLAQSANGASYSKCYIAQDGDLEIGVLPTTLDQKVQFIYVTPWRWISKKGIAGDPGISRLNVDWRYDWNLDLSSSRDLEYVAIRQQPFWPSLSQNWKSLGVNTLLGYNEPDKSTQDAYKNLSPPGSETNALAHMPDLLATGLRVGSPATTDGGRSGWLYPFVQQADAAGYRVDFIAIHYYWPWNPADPAGAANQMYNFLLDIWNHTQRPIWITEWNNGANWTDNQWPAPTYAQQQACVQAMVNMLESTPFVERYALYNWVEDTRSLVTSSNTVTPAGTVYSNTVSGLSYLQTMPDNGTRGIAEFLFATNTWDTSGYYNNALAVGAPGYGSGHNSQAQAIALDGTNSYLQLPANIAKGSAFTFAAWINWNGGGQWQRIFDFGSDTSHYLFLTPSSGGTTLRFAINNGSGEQIVERVGALASGSWQHVAVTLNGNTARLYVNGTQVAASTSFSIAPSAFNPTRNYLGKSQFTADPLFNGKMEAVEIADYALSAAQISVLYNRAQPVSYTSGQWAQDADGTWSDTNNWSNGLVATGTSRMADFSSVNLTADRTVTLDSARTIGGLRFGDTSGSQNWVLSGASTLTLDGGSPNPPLIQVNQNTATISTTLAGSFGLSKTGNGTLVLTAANSLGGGLTVSAGSVHLTGGATTFGSGVSSVGYLFGSGNLTITDTTVNMGGELRIGSADQNGSQFIATGTATLTNANLSVGSLTVARGNYLDNSVSGTLIINGGSTLTSANDVVLEYAGKGLGKLLMNGGNFIVGPTAGKWLMVGYWDSGAGELDINGGNLSLENGSSIKMSRGNNNTGANVVNQSGGTVAFYSDAGSTIGGGGSLDLNYAGGTSSSGTYNLNGGTLNVPQIIASSASGTRVFNFNGGTLRATGNSASFMASGVASAANVRNGGARLDTAGFSVAIVQRLQHSSIIGDQAVDGGLTKTGAGTLTLSGANTYTGPTTISAGTLALGSGGSLGASASFDVAPGAVFDVSAVSFSLGLAQSLRGGGTLKGAATLTGTIAPGPEISAFTFLNPPMLNGTTVMKINRTNAPNADLLICTGGTLTLGGVLTVTNIGPALQTGDSFNLLSAPIAGAFTATNLPALSAGLGWNFDSAHGVLSVVQTVATNPTNLVYQSTNGGITLSWPSDHLGWRLQSQTNSLGAGLGTNWFDVPDSAGTTNLFLPLNTNEGSVFYRLIFP